MNRAALTYFILAALCLLLCFFACSPVKDQQYAVRKVERLEKNAYLITTDSFQVVKVVRGMGKYDPDSVTRKGYSYKP